MDKFLASHAALVTSILSGFDRIVFRGHLMPLIRKGRMFFYLEAAKVRLMDFKPYVVQTDELVKKVALAEAVRCNRPIRYLESSQISKEQPGARKAIARSINPFHDQVFEPFPTNFY